EAASVPIKRQRRENPQQERLIQLVATRPEESWSEMNNENLWRQQSRPHRPAIVRARHISEGEARAEARESLGALAPVHRKFAESRPRQLRTVQTLLLKFPHHFFWICPGIVDSSVWLPNIKRLTLKYRPVTWWRAVSDFHQRLVVRGI